MPLYESVYLLLFDICTAHVIDVAVYQDTTTSRIDEYHMTPPVLILVEETPTPIKCVAEGGNPPPDVEMLMGRRDVTHLFHVQTYPTLSGEVVSAWFKYYSDHSYHPVRKSTHIIIFHSSVNSTPWDGLKSECGLFVFRKIRIYVWPCSNTRMSKGTFHDTHYSGNFKQQRQSRPS